MMGEEEQVFFRSGCVGAGRGPEKVLGWTGDTYGIYLVATVGNGQVTAEYWFEAQERGEGYSSRPGIVVM